MLDENADVFEEDIYAFFNLKRNATKDDINAAYRRLSRIYHPDKHVDAEKKRNAEKMFNKIRKYHSVLIDDQRRQLYDLSGGRGVDMLSNMQICELDPFTGRPMTAAQIRDEYERLVRKAEEEEFIEKTNPQGQITITINACDMFRPALTFDYDNDFESRLPEISQISIGQSVEAPAGPKDKFTVGGVLLARNGLGSGHMSVAWQRHVKNSCWSETEMLVGDEMALGFKLHGSMMSGIYGIGRLRLDFTSQGIAPSFLIGAYRPLDKHLTGSITTSFSVNPKESPSGAVVQNPSVTTSLTYDDNFTKRLTTFLVIGMSESYIGISASYKFRGGDAKVKGSLRYGTLGMSGQLGYERQASEHSTVGCSLVVDLPSHITLKLRWTRANQRYAANVVICDEQIYPQAVLYAIVAPIVLYNAFKWCLKPYLERRRLEQKAEEANRIKSALEHAKNEAEITVELMLPYAEQITSAEREIGGLVILDARYGSRDENIDEPSSSSAGLNETTLINVTTPLQAMVKNSELNLLAGSKAKLAGFYDPCYGQEKCLYVKYEYRGVLHRVAVKDEDAVKLPMNSHRAATASNAETSGFDEATSGYD